MSKEPIGSGEKGKQVVSRRRVNRRPNAKNDNLPETNYCRYCMQNLPSGVFYTASDPLDRNGLCSICKNCLAELYVKIYASEHTIQKAILKLCRMINLRYNEDAIASTIRHLNTQEKNEDDPSTFGIYKSKLMAVQKTEMGKRETKDLSFEEPPRAALVIPSASEEEEELRERWGEGYEYKDLLWLDHELAAWKETHKCSNRAEETLLQEIVAKKLEIRQLRTESKSTDTAVKALQELMRTAAYDPSKVNQANSGKNKEAFGVWIQEIETMRPAEWYEQNGLYRNLDGIEDYGRRFITEPLRRFVTGSRDFSFDDLGELSEMSDNEDVVDVDSE